MNAQEPERNEDADLSPTEAVAWSNMVLLTTLATATRVAHARAERRAGRDPSEQQTPDEVRDFLIPALAELRDLLMRLALNLARNREPAVADGGWRVAVHLRL